MKITPPTALAALVLIGAGGFMAGRVSSPAASRSADAPQETRTASRNASSRAAAAGGAADGRTGSFGSRSSRGGQAGDEERLAKLLTTLKGENAMERNRALLAFIDQLGPGDFEEVVAQFRGLGITEERMGEYSLLLTAWAEADPVAALDYASKNTGNSFARDTILTTWAANNPQAAIQWAKANYAADPGSDANQNPYFAAIIRGLAATDSTAATDLLTTMPLSQERGKALDFLLPHLLQQGSTATLDWINALADDNLKSGAMTRAAESLARTDPAGTAAWLLANPGEATQRRMDDVYSVWASADTGAAISALAALPAGENRSNALRGVVNTMASDNPQAALNLLNRYPNDVTDQVLQQFVRRSVDSDPNTAVSQIGRIGDAREREQAYRRTLDRWYDRDPSAALGWAQGHDIPDSVRAHLSRRQSSP